MENNKTKLAVIFSYIKQNGFAFGAFSVLFVLILIMGISTYNFSRKENTKPKTAATSPSNTLLQQPTQKTTIEPSKETLVEDYKNQKTLGEISFGSDDLKGVEYNKKTLPNGVTEYSTSSKNPNRPNITQVQNGKIIFQRMQLYGATITYYLQYHDNPDYKAQGSKFYGNKAQFYVYLTEGDAFVINPANNAIYEQYSFQPMAISEFKKNYGEDIMEDFK